MCSPHFAVSPGDFGLNPWHSPPRAEVCHGHYGHDRGYTMVYPLKRWSEEEEFVETTKLKGIFKQ